MDTVWKVVSFVVLLLVQVLVLNHVRLLGYATPLLYCYFIIDFRRGYPRWATLLWGFFLGLAVDIFANTPGVATGSMTLIALLQPYLMELFIPRDSADNLHPTLRNIGLGKYAMFSSLLVFVYCLSFYSLELFNFFNWELWLLSVVGSTVITEVLILVVDNLRRKK